jgi:hypothetical protein
VATLRQKRGGSAENAVHNKRVEIKITQRFPRGICCHEAGHAVVAFSLGIRVVAVNVIFTKEKDWHGRTVTDGTPDHWKDQVVLRMAGKAAEEVLNCSADPTASFHDMLEVESRRIIATSRSCRGCSYENYGLDQ